MATRTEIIQIRLRIADPANIINIIDVDILADLPKTPAPQTSYYVVATGNYMITTETSGAQESDYTIMPLRVADSYITVLITNYGLEKAICYCFQLILTQLGNELRIVRNQDGTESTQFADIKQMMDFYRQLRADCVEQTKELNNNSTGKIMRTRQPPIAGGNI
jgi:hypothetical protein